MPHGKHHVGQEAEGERKAWPEPSLWPPQEGMGEAGPAVTASLGLGSWNHFYRLEATGAVPSHPGQGDIGPARDTKEVVEDLGS